LLSGRASLRFTEAIPMQARRTILRSLALAVCALTVSCESEGKRRQDEELQLPSDEDGDSSDEEDLAVPDTADRDSDVVEDGAPQGGTDDSEAGTGAAPRICGQITILGAGDHSGTSVTAGDTVSTTTDSEGKYCLPSTGLNRVTLTLSRAGHELFSIRDVRVEETATGPALTFCKRVVTLDYTTSRVPRCMYTDISSLELPRATRVSAPASDVIELVAIQQIFPGDGDAYLFTHNWRAPPRTSGPLQPLDIGVVSLSRGFSDGRPSEPVALDIPSINPRVSQRHWYFWAPTVQGNMFFYETKEGTPSAVLVSGGAPLTIASGDWLGVSPDGRTAVVTDALDGSFGVSAVPLAHMPGQQQLSKRQLTTSATTFDNTWPSSDDEQRVVRFGPDGWVYFWDDVNLISSPNARAALRRVKLEGGTSELVAESSVVSSLEYSGDLPFQRGLYELELAP
jgi:hypothetical protein